MDPLALDVDGFHVGRKRVVGGVRTLEKVSGPILYWMSRDQRVQDNWALLYSQGLALRHRLPLIVCFCLVPKFLEATFRHYHFMLEGLKEVEKNLSKLKIPFHLFLGPAHQQLPPLISHLEVSAVVCDFSPLRVPTSWVTDVAKSLDDLGVPLIQVDAHNIVPCWMASDKQEYAARTIRGKITSKLPTYLVDFPAVTEHPHPLNSEHKEVDWEEAVGYLEVDMSVGPVSWATPGTAAGMKVLEEFCEKRLAIYGSQRNDPNRDALSNLSPWLHFGQISAQRAVLRVKEAKTASNKASVDAFIEEVVVRRELSDNYCYYNESYDSIEGAPPWAQDTLRHHEKDKREKLYSEAEFEEGKTYDPLWNAAQLQMVREGKMHGYMRMYWAKKILEWTPSPAEALRLAIKLNDKYELDGRDPNGYVGCMWSICGVHDQGWRERPVFGKIRYMNFNSCKRKFDVETFAHRHTTAKRKVVREDGAWAVLAKKSKRSKS